MNEHKLKVLEELMGLMDAGVMAKLAAKKALAMSAEMPALEPETEMMGDAPKEAEDPEMLRRLMEMYGKEEKDTPACK